MIKRLCWLVAVCALALPFAVMAQDATPEVEAVEPIELPAVDPLSVFGDIVTAGSSTLGPLSARMAQAFSEDGYADIITVDEPGTGTGFQRFCEAGETDIANASRAINDAEIENCRAIGREPIEFRVGTDALVVVVGSTNDFVDSLTLEQLAAIFSGAVTTWDQVDPSFPAAAIQLFSPGTESGTFDYFVEAVLENEDGANLGDDAAAAALQVPGIQTSGDDNILVQGIEASPYAIGYFGFAYYVENQDRLKALALDFGDGAVEPSAETAEDGTYPLARPLYIYSDATVMAEKPQVAAFINYYLTNVNDYITEVGYFPASVEALNAAKQAWLDAVELAQS